MNEKLFTEEQVRLCIDESKRRQRKIDIEKACEWLEKNIHEDLSIGTWEDNKQSILVSFRNAM